MHYLIDGHNLIAKLPDIRLSDPDDEAQLIMKLRQWTAAGRKRRATVYFDGGLPGGAAPHFSGGRIKVIFASVGREADELMIGKIKKVHNPPEYTLVTSDRAIRSVAKKRGMPLLSSDEFAAWLVEEAEERERPQPPPPGEEPLVSEEEVAEWLELFGPTPEPPPKPRHRPRRRKPRARTEEDTADKAAAKKAPEVRPADALKDSGAKLTDAEVEQWLELFDEEPDEETLQEIRGEVQRRRQEQREQKRKKRGEGRPADALKDSGAGLSRDEVEEWLDIFREGRDEARDQ
jgi:predicted RNA-binding protein with PIN domain